MFRKIKRNFCEKYCYTEVEKIKNCLTSQIDIKPKVGIVCGSGLGSIGEAVKNPFKIEYKDIPNFLESTVAGHSGSLLFGCISEVPVVCMLGRFHFYEGYRLSDTIMPIRLMKLLGVTHLIVSNAAGAVNPSYKVGDIMVIKDQLNIMGMSGNNPLVGRNEPKWGTRFPAMTKAYDPDIIKSVLKICKELKIEDKIRQGVYACVSGPTYETVAEVKALKILGADAVGMSTAHEIIAARHCGIKCFGFSVITNVGSSDYDKIQEANHEEVLKAGKATEKVLKPFIERIVAVLGCNKK